MPHVAPCSPFLALAYPTACWRQHSPSLGASKKRKRSHCKCWHWTLPLVRRDSVPPSDFRLCWPNLSRRLGPRPVCRRSGRTAIVVSAPITLLANGRRPALEPYLFEPKSLFSRNGILRRDGRSEHQN